MSSVAPKEKAFDRGGPVWPPRSNAKSCPGDARGKQLEKDKDFQQKLVRNRKGSPQKLGVGKKGIPEGPKLQVSSICSVSIFLAAARSREYFDHDAILAHWTGSSCSS